MTRLTHSLDEIKQMLLDRLDAAVDYFAPPQPGAYQDKGLYFTLNPGRADRSVGSFVIHMTGERAGQWNDYATGSRGDILDLAGLAANGDGRTDVKTSLREARAFLGLDTQDPAAARRREDQRRASAEARRRRDAETRDQQQRRRNIAQKIWLSGSADLRGTPVDLYLRQARDINLARLGRAPGVLRFLPDQPYRHMDKTTGEVFEGTFPAMGAAICDMQGNFTGLHRTFLTQTRGMWTKAPVPAAKKVLGMAWECSVNVWRGTGPRGGKPKSLPMCGPGTHVYLTEGIEDALSVAILLPDARTVAAISLGNLSAIRLPKNVATVTIVADQDENDQARDMLARAIDHHRQAGRTVHLWQNRHGGKDLNDALRAALRAVETDAAEKADHDSD